MIWLIPIIGAICNVFAGMDEKSPWLWHDEPGEPAGRLLLAVRAVFARLPMGVRWFRLPTAAIALGATYSNFAINPAFVAVTLGFIVWRIPGWDMMAIHGRIGREKCKPVTWLTKALLDDIPIASVSARKNWGAVWMAIRGLFILPLFVSLAALSGNPSVAFLGFGGVLQGVAYRMPGCFAETRWSGMIAEALTGAAFGLLLTFALFLLESPST